MVLNRDILRKFPETVSSLFRVKDLGPMNST